MRAPSNHEGRQLSIRGFGARSSFGVRGLRLYVDGIPAAMPVGQGQLSHIDLASAGRIEVSAGMNFDLLPSCSRNLELGVKGRTALGGDWRSQWTAALFQVGTRGEIVTRTNSGGRSSFQNAGATRRRGMELLRSAATDAGWQVQAAQTWLDASYRENFGSRSGVPCAPLVIPAGNRIPGTARSMAAVAMPWQPAHG